MECPRGAQEPPDWWFLTAFASLSEGWRVRNAHKTFSSAHFWACSSVRNRKYLLSIVAISEHARKRTRNIFINVRFRRTAGHIKRQCKDLRNPKILKFVDNFVVETCRRSLENRRFSSSSETFGFWDIDRRFLTPDDWCSKSQRIPLAFQQEFFPAQSQIRTVQGRASACSRPPSILVCNLAPSPGFLPCHSKCLFSKHHFQRRRGI